MSSLAAFRIENCSFPSEEHRVAAVQVAVSLTARGPDGAPSCLSDVSAHTMKLSKALTTAIRDHWANIVVLPEISVPADSLPELMELAWGLVRARPAETGACLICLPVEYLRFSRFRKLLRDDLSNNKNLASGDRSLTGPDGCQRLFALVPPASESTAFVNVAVLLACNPAMPDAPGQYFFQPKRYPYPLERQPGRGRFLQGRFTYVLQIGDHNVMTSICYDLIAQPGGKSLFISDLLQDARAGHGGIHYLLLPQCNNEPLDYNFQRAVVDLYHHAQVETQTMRVVSPNVAHINVESKAVQAGHSWLVTCPFKSELPALGLWERTLASVLKDPSTGEMVRDAPSLGHYAQRLRLSARGEWLLCFSLPPAEDVIKSAGPNLPVRPHTGMVCEWTGTEWQQKDQSMFLRECQHAERLPGLHILTDLSDWVRASMGGRNAHSPSYEEFAGRKVYLPKTEREEVLSLLKASNDVWVRGARGCGKTVFGLAVAFEWAAEMNGRSLFLDLKELDLHGAQSFENARSDIEWFVRTTQQPLLLILDNVHIDQQLAHRLLKRTQALRAQGMQVHVLLLGRLSEHRVTDRNSLYDEESLKITELRATEEAFRCVARRLTQRLGIDREVASGSARRWVKQCGGDLAVFATAFDPRNPGTLSRSSITSMVQQRYLIPADRAPGQRKCFSELCVLGSLDLDAEDNAIWGQSIETLLPEFTANGTVLRAPIRGNSPRLYCRLFHPSLGELILQAQSGFDDRQFSSLWLSHVLAVCRRYPFMVGLVNYRLASGDYNELMSHDQWSQAVMNEDGLVERALCNAPPHTARSLKRGDIPWSWQRLCALQSGTGYIVLLNNLVRVPPNYVADFLRYLDGKQIKADNGELVSTGIVHHLLALDQFAQTLAHSPAAAVANFLKYLDSRQIKAGNGELVSTGIVHRLLALDQFVQALARSPAGEVVNFLRYLDIRQIKADNGEFISTGIVRHLLALDQFTQALARTPLLSVVNFLKYLDIRQIKADNGELVSTGIVHHLLALDQFAQTLARSPAGEVVVNFLKYLDIRQIKASNGELAGAGIVRRLLAMVEFNDRLARMPPNRLVTFLDYLGGAGLNKELQNAIADLLHRELFVATLFESSPNDQGVLLMCLCRMNHKEDARTLLERTWGRLDLPTFEARLHNIAPYNIIGLVPAIRRSRLHLPEESWQALMKSIHGDSYKPPTPDPEYPQSRLLAMSADEIGDLLTTYRHDRYKLNCIRMSLISNEEKLKVWTINLSPGDATFLRDMIIHRRIGIPSDIWDLLQNRSRGKSI